ncbi:GntR family transcriptional regulator [Fodinicola feengrottensis]|uniref:GntR family transcriptional regulator n=1 Tax=Fodinicola feengrottensis TaxID=435914 RepID=A0ABP4TRA9_9ACTN|nr:GntR family transcriptional regulator [Fodinicola feengrottensis]
MIVEIDPRSATPPYEQLRVQVTEQARSGVLPAGTRLPPVRQLATDLGIAANTVARTYRELEQDGVVVTRGRHGTFVAASPDAGLQAAHEAALAYAARVRQLGIDADKALSLVKQALRL